MNDRLDDSLLSAIDRAFDDLDPVPPHLGDAARSAFAWRRADAELAELLFDSATDELVGVRGTSSDRRSFRFGTDDAVIRVHLTAESLVVMIEPPISLTLRISTHESSDVHRTDEYGELVVPAPDLPVRIEVELPGGDVVTPWITG